MSLAEPCLELKAFSLELLVAKWQYSFLGLGEASLIIYFWDIPGSNITTCLPRKTTL